MSGILFLVGMMAFLAIIYWYIQNEMRGDQEGSTGILRVRKDCADESDK